MTVSEKLRLVQGLHSHTEMFGFSWDDGSDWTWHDVACKIADEIDAENAKLREENVRLRSCLSDDAENARMIMGENAKLRELVKDMWANQEALPYGLYIEIRDRMRELRVVR